MIKLINKAIGEFQKKTIEADPFIPWLRFANPGMLNTGNIYCMEHAVRNLPSCNPVMEIGSFCGLSTNLIHYLLRKHGKSNLMFTCDKWIFEGSGSETEMGVSGISHRQYREFVIETFKRNLHFFSGSQLPHTIEAVADDFFPMWDAGQSVRDVFGREVVLGGAFSFAYIDGNHQYDFVKRDFINVDRNLETGGFILFDDSYDGNAFGITRLMKEIRRRGDYHLVMKNPNYLFRKI